MRRVGRKIGVSLVVFLGGLVLAGGVKAGEGNLVLENNKVKCEGVSLWREGRYKLVGKCYGLTYPYDTKRDRYVLWVEEVDGQVSRRVAEVERGYFEGGVESEFEKVFITAEASALPRKPGVTVVSGRVEKRGGEQGSEGKVSQAEGGGVLSQEERVTVQPVKTGEGSQASQTSAGLGKLLGRIVVAVLVIVGVVVGMVVLSSLMFRKKVE